MTDKELEKEAYQYDADHLRSGKGARWYHNVTVKEAYLAGAVPREKRIAELEQLKQEYIQTEKEYAELKIRCAELKDKLNNLASVAEVRLANWQKYEKENAELKKWQKDTIKARGNDYMDWSRMKDQLTKAKELLKRYVPYRQITDSKAYKDLADETEQFLEG